MYQQKRRRQAIVLIAATMFLAVVGLLGWLGVQLVSKVDFSMAQVPFVTPGPEKAAAIAQARESKEQAREAFRDLLDRKLGFINNQSLLYYGAEPYSALVGHADKRLLPMYAVQEDVELKNRLNGLFASYPSQFVPHLYYFDPQDGTYVNINGYEPAPAASVIKLPILLAYLMSLDENMLTVDTPLLYMEYHRAGGAGELQYRDAGDEYAANEIARNMIRISDNTCTNMIISYLGGTDAVNRRLEDLGLKRTRIRNWLPDLTGTNMVSPYEMATVLYNIENGTVVSQLSRHNGLDILQSTHNRRLIPAQLPSGTKIAHKTGDIGTVLGDSGIIYMPDNRKYILSVQVERPFNDYTARTIIQEASKIIYDYAANKPNPAEMNLASSR